MTSARGEVQDGAESQPASPGLGDRAITSVGWLTLQSWISKLGGFVTTILLARLLTPSDFGLMAVAATVLPVVYLMADLGFGTYLMQADKTDRTVNTTAFWYSTITACTLALAMVLGAPLLQALFGVDGVAGVIAALAPAVVFVGLGAAPIATLRREMRFRQLAIQQTVAALAGQAVAIILAINGAGVWALVAQLSTLHGVAMVGAWSTAGWRPAARFDWAVFRKMVGFGANVLGVEAITLARNWGETAIISNVLGAAALGQLSVAQRLVQTGQDVAGAAISSLSTVVFARVRGEAERLRRGYARASRLAYVVLTPVLVAIAVTSPALVPTLFGPQWTESINIATALAVAAIFTLGAALDNGLFYGMGRPRRWLGFMILSNGLSVAATALLVRFGIVSVAIGFLGTAALGSMIRWLLVSRILGTSVWEVSRPLLAAVFVAFLSGVSGRIAFTAFGGAAHLWATVAVGLVILVVHIAISRLVLADALREVVTQIVFRFRRVRSVTHK